MHHRYLAILCLASSACAGGLDDHRFATGSRTIAASSDYERLYVPNTDEGTVSVVEVASRRALEVEAGDRPTRVARAGDRVLVSLRGQAEVAIFTETAAGLKRTGTVHVGAEPVGVVASEDGEVAYVAVSLEDEVVEVDPRQAKVTARWRVPSEPRGLALHPSGAMLFVTSARDGALHRIDLEGGGVETVDLPRVDGGVTLQPRITGDPAIMPDGRELLIPATYTDVQTEVDVAGYAAARSLTGGRFTPVLVVVGLTAGGQVKRTPEAIFLGGKVTRPGGEQVAVTSYPSAVAGAPRGSAAIVTFEGSSAGVAVDLRERHDEDAPPPEASGISHRTQAWFHTEEGPLGIAFVDKREAWIHAWLDDPTVSRLAWDELGETLKAFHTGEPTLPTRHATLGAVVVARSAAPDDVVQGRRLFYAATDPRMSREGSGVSCASCHVDGRSDGLVWPFATGMPLRNTKSLAGEVSQTEPVTWSGEVPTTSDEVMVTSQLRMGGAGLTDEEADKVAAFIDWVPLPDAPTTEEVSLGATLFAREDVGCATCHIPPAFTDGRVWDISGREVDTPSLLGLAASGPWLHDGSARSLRTVLAISDRGDMGDTGHLDDRERAALRAYLRSL